LKRKAVRLSLEILERKEAKDSEQPSRVLSGKNNLAEVLENGL
jgi:hypothetical protein